VDGARAAALDPRSTSASAGSRRRGSTRSVLLAHALGSDRLRLYLEFDKPVVESERAVFRGLVRARANERMPVALLTGQREFWSLPLRVSPHVLIPRPDTETLVAAALDLLPDRAASARVLDLGTGSGAVALALAAERPLAAVVATDRSHEALKVAQQNAEALGMAGRIHFLRGDWATALAAGRSTAWSRIRPISRTPSAPARPGARARARSRAVRGPTGLEALERLCREVPALLLRPRRARVRARAGQAKQVRRGSSRPASPPRCTATSRAARAWSRAGRVNVRAGVQAMDRIVVRGRGSCAVRSLRRVRRTRRSR
jgi:release factor glutamine methyltransferase